MSNKKFMVCVYGAVTSKMDNSYIEAGVELGKRIADKNWGLVYSGMEDGISGAVAKGAFENKCDTIVAIMPEFFKEERKDLMFENTTERIYVKDLSDRKKKFRETADAIIVTPGGVGTFDELFDAICAKRLKYIDIPIVIYNMNNFYANLLDMIDYSIANKFALEVVKDAYKVCENVDEIIEYIESY